MTIDEARAILRKATARGEYYDIAGDPDDARDELYVIDGRFSVLELEAMVTLIRGCADEVSE